MLGGSGDLQRVGEPVADKSLVFGEIFRVLRPGGRIQIADITVETAVPEAAKRDIDLWTG